MCGRLTGFPVLSLGPCGGGLSKLERDERRSGPRLSAAIADAPLFVPGEWSQIAIVADGLVGDIGLCLDDASHEVEIGITLARGAQGLGYARRAVRLAVHLVWRDSSAQCIRAITDARNAAALILLERSGFREGPTLITDGIPERQFTLNRPNLP